jgi:hypothetical protein
MTERTHKTKRPAHVTLSFRDEKNLDAKPPISDAEARRLLTAIEAGDWAKGVPEETDCTLAGCGLKTAGLKQLINLSGITVSCRYSCEWFYSKGGGWEHVCYANCQGGGLQMEAVLY